MGGYRPPSFSWNVAEQTHPGVFETYRDSFADLYDVGGVSGRRLAQFASRTRLTLFRAGVVAEGRSTAQTLIRTPEAIRRSGIDSITLTLVKSPMVGDSEGRNVASQGGTIHLQDLSRPMTSQWESLHIVNLTVPRPFAGQLAGRDIHGLVLDGRGGAGRLIANHLQGLAEEAGTLTEAEGEAAVQAAILMIERALGRDSDADELQLQAISRTVRAAAIRHIRRNLMSPGLNVDGIARASGASRSTLYRAFEGFGGVASVIQRLRLDHAREALRLRRDGQPTVTEVAFAHGFASQAHFSRAYRARFGYPPSDEPAFSDPRAIAFDQAGAEIQHDRVADWLRAGDQAVN